MIDTAKANGIEPWAYLKTVFAMPPAATSHADIDALLPQNFDSISNDR